MPLPAVLSSPIPLPRHTSHTLTLHPTCPAPQPCYPLPATLTIGCPRDLTDNQLTTLPLAGLGGLMHLKLKGNPALFQAFSKDSFPKLR